MTRRIFRKFDRLINIITMLLLVGGGMIIHTLTALTLKNYYGDPWGYVSFTLPVISEAYLITIQLADEMYNFTLLFISFICLSLIAGAAWIIKNIVRQRIESLL